MNSALPLAVLLIAHPPYTVVRLNGGNPIITRQMFIDAGAAADGASIASPSVIALPSWLSSSQRASPSANYYLYFCAHHGTYIRMAWAAALTGPWTLWNVHSSDGPGEGVLDLKLGSNSKMAIGSNLRLRSHLATPFAQVDDANQRIVLYLHAAADRLSGSGWSAVSGQHAVVATSADGLNFNILADGGQSGHGPRGVLLGNDGFSVFSWGGQLYAMSSGSRIYRAPSASAPWTPPPGFNFAAHLWTQGDNPLEDDTTGPIHIRQVATRVIGDTLEVFHSRKGDAPERILHCTIDLAMTPWTAWNSTYPPERVVKPNLIWEGANRPLTPSSAGAAPEDVNQLRTPHIFVPAAGYPYLFYAGQGEDAIGVARLATPGDFDADGHVDAADYLELLERLGACPPSPADCPWDLNDDGSVADADEMILLENWG